MPPFKDEHILVIAPGSQTTLAQLGLPESYTPARLRVRTRMFPAEKPGEWEPLKVREKKAKKNGLPEPREEIEKDEDEEEDLLYEEDPTSDEGAVYPLKDGRVTNWSCFFALITHIHNTLSPPFHTPILLIAQPSWTQHDHEILTQFFFEKFKTPAFALMDHALATTYAYSVNTATVVDVGFEKCDVTAVNDFCINDIGRGIAISGCGGENMTQRLLDLLNSRGFNEEMCEQLKRSNICEILPTGTSLPLESKTATDRNPASVASTGVTGSGLAPKLAGAVNGLPRGPGAGTEVGGEDLNIADPEENEGVLDVASIVTSGKTSEFLAKKEREKAEKAAAKKQANEASAAAKIAKLPNSQRPKATFHYTERRPAEELEMNVGDLYVSDPAPKEAQSKEVSTNETVATDTATKEAADISNAETKKADTTDTVMNEPITADTTAKESTTEKDMTEKEPTENGSSGKETTEKEATEKETATAGTTTAAAVTEETAKQPNGTEEVDETTNQEVAPVVPQPQIQEAAAPKKEERRRHKEKSAYIRKEIEVGVERFRAVDNGILDHIADSIHRCVLSVPEISKRSELWDSLIIVGNGSRVRGFKEALLATLNAKYLISPSSATIFTSELPSNFSTPLATGANTPQPQAQPTHHGSGVNPLLLAATTASNNQLAPPNHQLQALQQQQQFPQTPPHQQMGQPFQPSPLGLPPPQQQQHQHHQPGLQGQSHSGHGQSPTSIKLAKMSEYFPEWKDAGFEEAHFLGAQVAAKIVFIIDQGLSKGFMSRTEYNDLGPQGIHEFAI